MAQVYQATVKVNTDGATKQVDELNQSLKTTKSEVSELKSSGKAFNTLKKGAKSKSSRFI